jgi:hypothetical protein
MSRGGSRMPTVCGIGEGRADFGRGRAVAVTDGGAIPASALSRDHALRVDAGATAAIDVASASFVCRLPAVYRLPARPPAA